MEHLLNHRCKVITELSFRYLIQIHKYRDKRCLAIRCHQRNHLILDHLDTTVDLFLDTHLCDLINHLIGRLNSGLGKFLADDLAELLTAYLHKRSQMCKGNTLSSILGACDLCDRLCGDVTCCGKALRLVDHRLADDRSVL